MEFKLTKGVTFVWAIIVWALVILAIAFGAFFLKPWQTKPIETISVSAQGKAEAVPNIAKISATVETQNPNLDEARSQNEAKVAQIISKLKELGIEQKDIQTQNISAGPGYEIQIYPAPRKPNTNQFSTSLEITIRKFETSDEIIATLTQNTATNIYGPNLTLDETAQEEAKSKAREDAIIKAKDKARQLAQLSERKLGKVTQIEEQGEPIYPVPIYAQSETNLRQKASQIQPGQNEVSVTIQVEFELK